MNILRRLWDKIIIQSRKNDHIKEKHPEYEAIQQLLRELVSDLEDIKFALKKLKEKKNFKSRIIDLENRVSRLERKI